MLLLKITTKTYKPLLDKKIMEMRITLGKIEDLIKDSGINHLGKATFRRKDSFSKVLVFDFPKERGKIEMLDDAPFYNPFYGMWHEEIKREASIKFISYMEQFLQERGLYLAEALYKPYRYNFDFPFPERLEGELYQNGK